MVCKEEMVSEENDRGEELSEAGLVLVRRQQLLQTDLLKETRVTFEHYIIYKRCTEKLLVLQRERKNCPEVGLVDLLGLFLTS